MKDADVMKKVKKSVNLLTTTHTHTGGHTCEEGEKEVCV